MFHLISVTFPLILTVVWTLEDGYGYGLGYCTIKNGIFNKYFYLI